MTAGARLGVAIHGAGNVATQYIQAFSRNPHTEVRMITSRTAEAARRCAAAYGLTCETADRLDAALGRDDVDIVAICTPNHLHAREAMLAARAGKHLVVEKPIALTLRDLRAVEAAVEEYRVKATVGFVLRWNPLVRMARRLVRDGTLGDLVLVEADYIHRVDPVRPGWEWKGRGETSGGALLMGGCHAVDALRFCAGDVASVSAYAAHVARREFDYPPTVTASLRFAGGAVGKVSVTFEAYTPYVFNINLYGSRGTLRNNQLYAGTLEGQTGYATIPTVLPDSADVTHHPFQAEVDDLVAAIREDRAPVAALGDAARSHEVCLAIDRAWAAGRAVTLPLPEE
ncbi:MAG TPA: Gfo/Idh/MocA family oxidoreductase [bacterium]|nr:Gfo/Idh/MocA family oxidoreductase [bacterium]